MFSEAAFHLTGKWHPGEPGTLSFIICSYGLIWPSDSIIKWILYLLEVNEALCNHLPYIHSWCNMYVQYATIKPENSQAVFHILFKKIKASEAVWFVCTSAGPSWPRVSFARCPLTWRSRLRVQWSISGGGSPKTEQSWTERGRMRLSNLKKKTKTDFTLRASVKSDQRIRKFKSSLKPLWIILESAFYVGFQHFGKYRKNNFTVSPWVNTSPEHPWNEHSQHPRNRILIVDKILIV